MWGQDTRKSIMKDCCIYCLHLLGTMVGNNCEKQKGETWCIKWESIITIFILTTSQAFYPEKNICGGEACSGFQVPCLYVDSGVWKCVLSCAVNSSKQCTRLAPWMPADTFLCSEVNSHGKWLPNIMALCRILLCRSISSSLSEGDVEWKSAKCILALSM